jgi:hypothetical protein
LSSVLRKAFGVKARRGKSAISRRCGLRLEYLAFEEGRAARGIIARALGSGIIIRIKKFLLFERDIKRRSTTNHRDARDERREKRPRRKGTTEDAPSLSRDLKLVLVRNGVVRGITFFILFCQIVQKVQKKSAKTKKVLERIKRENCFSTSTLWRSQRRYWKSE